MKVATLFFAAGAAAAGIVARQGNVLSDALNSISAATTDLQNGIASFSGAGDIDSLQAQADAVVQAIQDGQTAVEPIGVLSTAEVAQLAQPLLDLVSLVNSTVVSTIAQDRIDAFTAAGATSQVLDALNAIKSATQSFSDVAVSKVPEGPYQQVAQEAIGSIIDSLNQAIAVYSDLPTDGGDTTTTEGPGETTTGSEPEPTDSETTPPVYGGSTTTEVPPVYETPAPSGGYTAPPYDTTSAPYGNPTTTPKPYTPTTTPAPYNPNGAASNAAGMGAVAVAALAAIAAF